MIFRLFIIIVVLLVVSFKAYSIYSHNYVKNNSERYAKLLDINERYSAKKQDYNKLMLSSYRFDTKPKFDNPNNKDKVLKEYLYKNRDTFDELFEVINDNVDSEKFYQELDRTLHPL